MSALVATVHPACGRLIPFVKGCRDARIVANHLPHMRLELVRPIISDSPRIVELLLEEGLAEHRSDGAACRSGLVVPTRVPHIGIEHQNASDRAKRLLGLGLE